MEIFTDGETANWISDIKCIRWMPAPTYPGYQGKVTESENININRVNCYIADLEDGRFTVSVEVIDIDDAGNKIPFSYHPLGDYHCNDAVDGMRIGRECAAEWARYKLTGKQSASRESAYSEEEGREFLASQGQLGVAS